ncbi:expressed unknown protein [Ectocarpus siliculosus]|uniref:Uncharacterized protein n=1 Tax=Ectocarpus siliculosus TaxID=2880 RepID=D7FHD9_ECTSI|nr:expressed unknown protein [Ectocarpus siliculosus]|eukprot:CBJ28506.1 expressed unknown protein [Ectocarpus siliculosus]
MDNDEERHALNSGIGTTSAKLNIFSAMDSLFLGSTPAGSRDKCQMRARGKRGDYGFTTAVDNRQA